MLKLEELQALTEKIRSSIGEEPSALISNDLIGITGAFAEYDNELKLKNEMIQKLENDKKELLLVNSQLFQKIGFESKEDKKEEEKKDVVELSSFINEKGDFI